MINDNCLNKICLCNYPIVKTKSDNKIYIYIYIYISIYKSIDYTTSLLTKCNHIDGCNNENAKELIMNKSIYIVYYILI